MVFDLWIITKISIKNLHFRGSIKKIVEKVRFKSMFFMFSKLSNGWLKVYIYCSVFSPLFSPNPPPPCPKNFFWGILESACLSIHLSVIFCFKLLVKICCYCIHPFPDKPLFLRVCCTSLLKPLWEKEKLLVISNYSFSYSVFYPFGKLSAIILKFKIIACRHLQLERI